MDGKKPVTIHAAFATVLIFLVLFSPVWVAATFGIYHQDYLRSFGILASGLFFLLWICSGTVYLDNDRLAYGRYFFICRSVELKSITAVNVVSNPAPTLVLHGKHSRFSFVLKPFSKAGVALIVHHVRLHAPNATFDEISSDLEHGDFASFTRETLRVRNLSRLFGAILVASFTSAFAAAKMHSPALTLGIIIAAALLFIMFELFRKRHPN